MRMEERECEKFLSFPNERFLLLDSYYPEEIVIREYLASLDLYRPDLHSGMTKGFSTVRIFLRQLLTQVTSH